MVHLKHRKYSSNYPGAHLGWSVSSADVNGDGYSDVILGGPGYKTNEGRVWIYHGSSSGASNVAAWILNGGQAAAQFGASVAGVGDMDGDGFADVIVGAPYYDFAGFDNSGRVWYYGGNNDNSPFNRQLRQKKEDFSGPIARLGIADTEGTFGIVMRAYYPAGRTNVRMQWEAKPLGDPFDLLDVETSTTESASGFTELMEVVENLDAGTR